MCSKQTKFVIKNALTKRTKNINDITGKIYETFKDKLIPILTFP